MTIPSGIGEKGTRPRTAYRLLIVEATHGLVLGSDLLVADPNLRAVHEQVPQAILRLLARTGMLPRVVRTRSQILLQLLDEMADDLGFAVEECYDLPHLDRAQAFERQFLGR